MARAGIKADTPYAPVLLVVLDGVGLYRGQKHGYHANAFDQAYTPTLDWLDKSSLSLSLCAHGQSVGLPSDKDLGNSEVGHNTMGSGRILSQGAKLVQDGFKDKSLFKGKTWPLVVQQTTSKPSTLHLIGLLSDGNVHSHIDHALELIHASARDHVSSLRLHVLLDGRDVHPHSARIYIDRLEKVLEHYRAQNFDYHIASGGGRMTTTMDRYGANWDVVKAGWDAHVHGMARHFTSIYDALETLSREGGKPVDQDLPPFVIAKDGVPVGPIRSGDTVILFNFRGDRAIGLSKAFEWDNFSHFDRGLRPRVLFVGMMTYDGDLNLPRHALIKPPPIQGILSEHLSDRKVHQFAISETHKFGHISYFWNGNNSKIIDPKTETWHEVPSESGKLTPHMAAQRITETLVTAIQSRQYDFLRVNYANGDMIGHTGNLEDTIEAMAHVDTQLNTLIHVARAHGITTIVTADHGNCEQMRLEDGRTPCTSHTRNPVPLWILPPSYPTSLMSQSPLRIKPEPSNTNTRDENNEGLPYKRRGLANIASTVMVTMGINPPSSYEPSVVERLTGG